MEVATMEALAEKVVLATTEALAENVV